MMGLKCFESQRYLWRNFLLTLSLGSLMVSDASKVIPVVRGTWDFLKLLSKTQISVIANVKYP